MHAIAGLSTPQEIDYVRVADLSTSATFNSKGSIKLSDVDIDVDIFHFLEVENADQSSPSISLCNASSSDPNHATPQARITSLPSRNLSGLSGSYASSPGVYEGSV